ncbi:hypothetical protein ABBQ38_011182 [Trebouxia sp. C0009 RCD-2024]
MYVREPPISAFGSPKLERNRNGQTGLWRRISIKRWSNVLLSALKALILMQQQQQQQSDTNAPFIVEHAMPNHAVVAHQQIQSDCSDVCLSKGLCACAFLSDYEMLNMFGVYVHACVDGCFNFVVYAGAGYR